MKTKIFKKGLPIIAGFIIGCVFIAVMSLIFNTVGYLSHKVFTFWEDTTYMDYTVTGVFAILALTGIGLLSYSGIMLFIKLVPKYDTTKENKKSVPYRCPFDIKGRSCKDMNVPDGYITCKDCPWYNNGVRPSKF